MKGLIYHTSFILFIIPFFGFGHSDVELLKSNMEMHKAASPDSSMMYCDLIIAYYLQEKNIDEEAFYTNQKGILYKRKAEFIKAETSYSRSLDLYKRSDNQVGIGIALNNLGEIKMLQGQYTESLNLHRETLSHKERLRDTFGIGSSYLNIGNVYLYQSQYEEAIENYVVASDMFTVINDSLRLSSVYNNLGALHNYIDNTEKALDYWELSLSIKKRVGNRSAIAKALNNLAEIYMSLGDLDQALAYLLESHDIKKDNKDKESYLVTTYNLAECYRLKNEYNKALPYFKESEAILNKMPLSVHHAEFKNKMGLYFLQLQNYKKAESNLLESIANADSLHHMEIASSAWDNLSLTYSSQKKWKKSLEAKNQFIVIQDSLNRQAQRNKILELESQYEVKNKNQQIELLQSQNTIASLQKEQSSQRIKYLLLGVIALSALSLILYRNIRLKRKNSELLKEKNQSITTDLSNKNMIINEIHHRIKNNLAIIDSLINIQLISDEDISPEDMLKTAQNRIKSISALHDLLYENQSQQDVSLADYLSQICQQAQESYNLKARNIETHTQLKPINTQESNYIKIGLILNELITNSIKHGFNAKETGVINVTLESLEKKTALLAVSHTGSQPDPNKVLTSTGLGIQLIKGLSKQVKGSFDLVEGSTSKFVLTFPCEA